MVLINMEKTQLKSPCLPGLGLIVSLLLPKTERVTSVLLCTEMVSHVAF